MYMCPVCGYDGLRFPPDNYTICPSCGTKFSYSDVTKKHSELREEWLANGAHWQSMVVAPPIGWNPYQQLRNLEALEPQLAPIATATTNGQVHWEGQIIADSRQARFFSGRVQYFNDLNGLIRSQAA